MFFGKHHPEDKRLFSFLLVAVLLGFAIVGYGMLKLNSFQRPAPPAIDELDFNEITELIDEQREELHTQNNNANVRHLNTVTALSELIEKVEDSTQE